MNLLRPEQVNELNQEEAHTKYMLKQPDTDKGTLNKQLHRIQKMRVDQSPPTVDGAQMDRLIVRNEDLKDKILQGMPSQEEMRKAPPGSVSKHIAWEKRNKKAIVEWKNNQLTIHKGSESNDIANLELFRPVKSTLSMDNALIPGKQYHMPDGPLALHNVMSDGDKEQLEGTRLDLIQQALDNDDENLARFIGVDLKALKDKLEKDSEGIRARQAEAEELEKLSESTEELENTGELKAEDFEIDKPEKVTGPKKGKK